MVEDTVDIIKKYLKGNRWGGAPKEYLDYIMMTEKWKCPPSVYDEQPQDIIELHIQIYGAEIKAQAIEEKRKAQKMQ